MNPSFLLSFIQTPATCYICPLNLWSTVLLMASFTLLKIVHLRQPFLFIQELDTVLVLLITVYHKTFVCHLTCLSWKLWVAALNFVSMLLFLSFLLFSF